MTTKPTIIKRLGGYFCTSYDLEGRIYTAFGRTIKEAYIGWEIRMIGRKQPIGQYLINTP